MQTNQNEAMAEHMKDNLVSFMAEYKELGFKAVVKEFTDACNKASQELRENLITIAKDNLWDYSANLEAKKSQLECSTLYALTTKYPHASEDALVDYMSKLNFEEINKKLEEKLNEIKFDFEAYKEYVSKMKFMFISLNSDRLEDTPYLKC